MDLISQKIKNFIIENNIDRPKLAYIVAFSGGYDSTCLLHVLKKICNNKIIAIHLNHNWRGDESDKEEENCKNFCFKYGIEFYSEKLADNVEKNETTAREERYKFFQKCAQKFNSNIIFTAHNRNDNAETLIYRIAKGTGIPGLQGIHKKRDIYYRPLLNVERKDIEDYCKKHELKPNYDSSNDDIIHNRNLIRKKILPEFTKINPDILNSLTRLSLSAIEDTQIVDEYIQIIKKKIVQNNKFNTEKFLELSYPLQMRILYNIISPLVPQNYDRERIEILYDFILKNKESKSGKICSVTSGTNLFVCEKYFEIIYSKKNEPITKQIIEKCGIYNCNGICIKISECNNIQKNNKNIIYADLSNFSFPLELRTRQEGDIISPYGMNGHQKLKKYFNNKKIPNHEKDKIILLAKGSEILLACGIGTSEKIKVKTNPTHKIEIGD